MISAYNNKYMGLTDAIPGGFMYLRQCMETLEGGPVLGLDVISVGYI